jgi:hypothetical protein
VESAALVAVTKQVPIEPAVKLDPEIVQEEDVPVVAVKVTFPVPEPPVVIRVKADPKVPLVEVIDNAVCGFFIEKVTLAVAVAELASVPVIVTVEVEVVVGVPEITPVDEFKVNPLGSAPLVYVTVPERPVAVNKELALIAEFGVPVIV